MQTQDKLSLCRLKAILDGYDINDLSIRRQEYVRLLNALPTRGDPSIESFINNDPSLYRQIHVDVCRSLWKLFLMKDKTERRNIKQYNYNFDGTELSVNLNELGKNDEILKSKKNENKYKDYNSIIIGENKNININDDSKNVGYDNNIFQKEKSITNDNENVVEKKINLVDDKKTNDTIEITEDFKFCAYHQYIFEVLMIEMFSLQRVRSVDGEKVVPRPKTTYYQGLTDIVEMLYYIFLKPEYHSPVTCIEFKEDYLKFVPSNNIATFAPEKLKDDRNKEYYLSMNKSGYQLKYEIEKYFYDYSNLVGILDKLFDRLFFPFQNDDTLITQYVRLGFSLGLRLINPSLSKLLKENNIPEANLMQTHISWGLHDSSSIKTSLRILDSCIFAGYTWIPIYVACSVNAAYFMSKNEFSISGKLDYDKIFKMVKNPIGFSEQNGYYDSFIDSICKQALSIFIILSTVALQFGNKINENIFGYTEKDTLLWINDVFNVNTLISQNNTQVILDNLFDGSSYYVGDLGERKVSKNELRKIVSMTPTAIDYIDEDKFWKTYKYLFYSTKGIKYFVPKKVLVLKDTIFDDIVDVLISGLGKERKLDYFIDNILLNDQSKVKKNDFKIIFSKVIKVIFENAKDDWERNKEFSKKWQQARKVEIKRSKNKLAQKSAIQVLTFGAKK